MTHHVSSMLQTYPKDLGNIDQQKLAECIEACFECAQTCTALLGCAACTRRAHRHRATEGSRAVRGHEGRAVAEAYRALVEDGVPMATLSRALGRRPTWVHWLLSIHDLRLEPRPVGTTARRTRA